MEQKKHFYITLSLGFLVFFIMLIVVYLTIGKKASVMTTNPPSNTAVEKQEVTKYKGYVQLDPEKTEYKLGEKISVKVIADSDNQSISGFDLVINYDPTKIKYMASSLLDKDFQTIVKSKQGVLKITAYKSNYDLKGNPYINKTVMNLDFAPIKADKVNISLMFAKNKTNETNLLNDQNEDTLTKVISTSVTVK